MRRSWVAIGVFSTVLGLATLFVDVSGRLRFLDATWIHQIGLVAVIAAILIVVARVKFVREAPETTPDVEPGPRVSVPGEGFDRVLEAGDVDAYRGDRATTNRAYVRDVLRDIVATTIQLEHNVSSEAARRRVNRGTWTDDPVAARFLAEDGAGPSIRRRDRLLSGQMSLNERATRRTIEAIHEIGDWQRTRVPDTGDTVEDDSA